jgi:hypothetical protein
MFFLRGCILLLGLFVYILEAEATCLIKMQQQDSVQFESFDIAPRFRRGTTGWQQFLLQNLDVRGVARAMDSTAYVEYGLNQTALMEFTVCEDGEVCDVIIKNKQDISPEFAKEALRVMEKSPKLNSLSLQF